MLSRTFFFVPNVIKPKGFLQMLSRSIVFIPCVIRCNTSCHLCYTHLFLLLEILSLSLLIFPRLILYIQNVIHANICCRKGHVLQYFCAKYEYLLLQVLSPTNIYFFSEIVLVQIFPVRGNIFFDISYPNSFLLASVLYEVISICIFNVKIYLT